MGQIHVVAVVLEGSLIYMRIFRKKIQMVVHSWADGNEMAMTGYGLVVTRCKR